MRNTALLHGPMTLEEFLSRREIDEKPYLEFTDGKIEAKMSPRSRHSLIQINLLLEMRTFAPPRLGMVFPELRCTFAGRSIVPDIAFLKAEHLDWDENQEIRDEILRAPDIHIEIQSPEQSIKSLERKLAFSVRNGCELGWLISPLEKSVKVFRPDQPIDTLAAGDFLVGDPILPGFRLAVLDVFQWIKKPRPNPEA